MIIKINGIQKTLVPVVDINLSQDILTKETYIQTIMSSDAVKSLLGGKPHFGFTLLPNNYVDIYI